MVSIRDEIEICGDCSTVTIGDQCRSNSNIKGIVIDKETKHKYSVSMKRDLLEEIKCTAIAKKIETVKNLLLKSYVFTVNTIDGKSPMLQSPTLPRNMFFILPEWIKNFKSFRE